MPGESCPDVRTFQALLEESRPEGEPDDLVRHLETCADCRQTLETLAVEGSVWEEALRGLADLPREEPALRRLVEQLRREEPGAVEDLSFLHPADKPGLIGMLGPYEVQAVVGRGGMGVVLKALEPVLNRVVAVKVLSPYLACSATARRRFVREAQAAAAVCHDHIVTVHGVHEADGLLYLVMQYIAGESLQDRLDRCGPLETAEVVRIGLQTALGLAAAHNKGLIHRDVKPANLLLEGEPGASATGGRVKITDFGLARMIDDVQLTQNGVVAGTPEYMAPEQARGEPIDHRADLFSLGSVLYAMCTGVPPFRGSSGVAVLRQVSDQTPTPIRSVNPDVPAWLEAFIGRLMAKDPADRFGSAAEVADLLEGCLAHLQQPETVSAPEFSALSAGCDAVGSEPPPRTWLARRLPRLWLPVLVLAASGLFGLLTILAQIPLPPSTGEEFYQDFRGSQALLPSLKLIGPDAAAVTRAEGEGLRITLPAHREPQWGGRPVGVALRFPLVGDFEITGAYELLSADRPATGAGVAAALNIAVNHPYKFAKVGRFVRAKEGNVYLAEVFLRGRPADSKGGTDPTEARRGQLRLVRKGATLFCLAADVPGNDFREILRGEFGTEDVEVVRFLVNNNDCPAAVDARLVDLRVRWGGVSGGPAVTPAEGPRSRSRGWLTAALLLGLGVLSSAPGIWLYRRHRRRSPTPAEGQPANPAAEAAVSFACAGCGKNLKAKEALAGKKVKCSGCGKTVLVPKNQPPVSNEARSEGFKGWLVLSLGLSFFALVLVPLLLWLCWPVGRPSSSFVNVALGSQSVAGVEDSGFYEDEQNNGGPFRWTDGKARLVVPLDRNDLPRALLVRLHRPKNHSLGIIVNQRELFREKGQDRELPWWEKTLDLTGVELGDKIVVEIVSDTAVPKIATPGRSEDGRTLGVRVREIRLLRERVEETTSPEAPSLFHLNLGIQSIPEVVDSGLYPEERDGEGLFRWTDGKARLVISLDKKEPPGALRVSLDKPQNRRLQIVVNGRTLIDDPANDKAPRRWERTLDLIGIDPGEKLVLDVVSNTTNPEKNRPIGVQVRAIKLLRSRSGAKTP